MTFKEWISTRWKNVLIVVLALFWMTQCTQRCAWKGDATASHGTIDSLELVIDAKQETIDSQMVVIRGLESDIGWMKQGREDIKDAVTTTRKELLTEISTLRTENALLRKDTARLATILRTQDTN